MEGALRYRTIMDNVPFVKYGLSCRLVEEEDFEFIFLLRSDKQRGRHLSQTNEDAESQRIWIKNYKLRERSGDEFYFICLDTVTEDKLGVFRLYNFNDKTFGSGSWLFKSGLKNQPIIGNILGKELGFDILKYDICRFDVRKENTVILAYHRLFNPLQYDEDDLNFYFELSNDSFEKTKNRLLKMFGVPNLSNSQ